MGLCLGLSNNNTGECGWSDKCLASFFSWAVCYLTTFIGGLKKTSISTHFILLKTPPKLSEKNPKHHDSAFL